MKTLSTISLIAILFLSGSFGSTAAPTLEETGGVEGTDYYQSAWSYFPGTCTSDNVICTYFTPDDVPHHAIARAMASAKKSLQIVIYSFSDDMGVFSEILNEQAKSGVKVEILADFKNTFQDHRVYNKLHQHHDNLTFYRVPVLRGSRPQNHNKFIIVDGEVVYTGSANYSLFGLIGNYEDTLSIRDENVVKKFQAEFKEIRALAHKACEVFRKNPSGCGKTREVAGFPRDAFDEEEISDTLRRIGSKWDTHLVEMLWRREGRVYSEILKDSPKCRDLEDSGRQAGLFNSFNQLRSKTLACLNNDAFIEYAKFVDKSEAFVDGEKVDARTQPWKKDLAQPNERIEVFFSPEDNLSKVYKRLFSEAAEHRGDAFIYGAPNFISDSNIVGALIEASSSGVRIRLLLDRGRTKDVDFRSKGYKLLLEMMGPLNRGSETGSKLDKSLTEFFHPFTNETGEQGGFGASHGKWAVIGIPDGSGGYKLSVISGSTNWSSTALTSNGENLVLIHDNEVGAIYLRYFLSMMLFSRYGNVVQGEGFQDELSYLLPKVRCLEAALGLKRGAEKVTSCTGNNGTTWSPRQRSVQIIHVEKVPYNEASDQIWAWVPRLSDREKNIAIPLFRHEKFARGRWVGVIPTQLGWKACFKLFAKPRHIKAPDVDDLAGNMEQEGDQNRCLKGYDFSIAKIHGIRWGKL